ncbi:unnamed protein product [Gordionus sp. m RMFG-2023]
MSTLVAAGNPEKFPVWIYEKDGIRKEMNGYWLGNLAMLDVQILNETVGIYSLKDKQPKDKSFQLAKLERFKKEIRYCDPLVIIWPAVSDYLAPNSYDPLLQVKSPDTDAKLINLTINGNAFNFSIEKCVPTGIYRVLIDEVLVAEISLDVKGEIVNIEAHDDSEHDVELDIGKFNISSKDKFKIYYLKDYSQEIVIKGEKYVIKGDKLTVRTKKLSVEDGNKYNETFIFENGKEIEVSGTASFEDEVKHVDYNYEMQYLELRVQRTVDRYYDRNMKNPKIFLIKANGIDADESEISVSNEYEDEHDFSIENVDGYLFLEIKPMIRNNISVEISFIHHQKILIVHLAPAEMVILTINQVSVLFLEGRDKSLKFERITPMQIREDSNRITIKANEDDGLIVVKENGVIIKAWFVITLGTENVTVNMITKIATISHANRFLRQDQCFQPLGIKLGNIRIKAKYNCDAYILELELKNISDSVLYNKSHLHALSVENHHVVNIRFNSILVTPQ